MNLTLTVNREQFDRYSRAGLAKGMIITEWIMDTIEKAAQRDMRVEKFENMAAETKESVQSNQTSPGITPYPKKKRSGLRPLDPPANDQKAN